MPEICIKAKKRKGQNTPLPTTTNLTNTIYSGEKTPEKAKKSLKREVAKESQTGEKGQTNPNVGNKNAPDNG
jgi:hypothetical protein